MDCLILVRAFPSSSAACTRRSTAWPERKKERRKKETRLSVSRVSFLLMGVKRGVVVVALSSPGCFEFGRESVRSPRRNFRKVTKFQQKGCNKRQSPRRKIATEIQQKGRTPPEEKTRNSQLARRPSELHQAPPDRRYTHRGFMSPPRAERATTAERAKGAAVKLTPHRTQRFDGKIQKGSKNDCRSGNL